jgi:hypothetical protein
VVNHWKWKNTGFEKFWFFAKIASSGVDDSSKNDKFYDKNFITLFSSNNFSKHSQFDPDWVESQKMEKILDLRNFRFFAKIAVWGWRFFEKWQIS